MILTPDPPAPQLLCFGQPGSSLALHLDKWGLPPKIRSVMGVPTIRIM